MIFVLNFFFIIKKNATIIWKSQTFETAIHSFYDCRIHVYICIIYFLFLSSLQWKFSTNCFWSDKSIIFLIWFLLNMILQMLQFDGMLFWVYLLIEILWLRNYFIFKKKMLLELFPVIYLIIVIIPIFDFALSFPLFCLRLPIRWKQRRTRRLNLIPYLPPEKNRYISRRWTSKSTKIRLVWAWQKQYLSLMWREVLLLWPNWKINIWGKTFHFDYQYLIVFMVSKHVFNMQNVHLFQPQFRLHFFTIFIFFLSIQQNWKQKEHLCTWLWFVLWILNMSIV